MFPVLRRNYTLTFATDVEFRAQKIRDDPDG
jgi:hypothetical protein